MTGELLLLKQKFECVLKELLKSDYKLTDDTILEKLVSHLSVEDEDSHLIDPLICISWVQSALCLWQQKKIKASVGSFALRLLGIILQNENQFMYLKSQPLPNINEVSHGVLEQFQNVITSESHHSSNFSMKFSFVKVLLSLLSHKSGCQWILSTGIWKYASQFSLNDSSIYVVRESRLFLSRLLNEIPSENEADAECVLAEILNEFISVPVCDGSSSVLVKLTPSLFLISGILERAFNTIDPDTGVISSVVVNVIYKPKFNVLQKALEILKCTDDEVLEEQLSKTAAFLYILHIIRDNKKLEPKDKKAICLELLNVFTILISKGSVHNVLKLCVLCHNHWTYVQNLKKMENNDSIENDEIKKYRFEDQLLCLQLAPIFCCIISAPFENEKELYIHKLFHSACHQAQRLLFFFRDTIIQLCEVHHHATLSARYTMCLTQTLEMIVPISVGCTLDQSTLEEIFVHQMAALIAPEIVRLLYLFRDSIVQKGLLERGGLQAVASLYAVKNLFPRERAVLIFQSFIYVLKHFVVTDESHVKQGGWGGEVRQSHHSSLLVAILDGLSYLVHAYRITWRESVESLCLLSLALQLLDSPTLSVKVGLVVQALKLIRLCIENFMPPNLALLTNTINGTSVDQLGPLIYKRLHDPNWEIRDSSLEVLHVIATISDSKYPLFQDLILENKLCEVTVHLALNDAESYVCASATKCLTAMVCVDRLWNDELQDKDLVNKMIGILSGESEGVLRREASLLISQIFKHRKVSEEVLHKICVTMSHVVISDLHWEAKVNALSFWELVIEHSMNNQGRIDGEFPSVTFSKEHRKIVNLTPDVIKIRLKKVLDELSKRGCLYVLLAAIQCEEDLEVLKKASQIITSLSKVLEQHGLLNLKCTVSPSSPKHIQSQSLCELPSVSEQTGGSPVPESLPSVNFEQESPLGDMENFKDKIDTPLINPSLLTKELVSPNSLKSEVQFETSFSPSMLALDQQAISFDPVDIVQSSVPPHTSLQDEVIDAILNDRDINLLASVYLGTEAELPGRQGPETKVSKTIRPLVIMDPNDFLQQLEIIQVNQIVAERVRWVENTGNNLGPLLDDMLIARDVQCGENSEECNSMDCY